MRQVFAAMSMSGTGFRAKHRQHPGKARRQQTKTTPGSAGSAVSRTGSSALHPAAERRSGIRPGRADALRARP